MSSPEVESFDITEEDLGFSIDPYARRGRKQTKSSAIYGVFEHSSDEEDARPGFGRSGKADYTSSINFISGGFKQGSKKKDEDAAEGDAETDEEDAEANDDIKEDSSEDERPFAAQQKKFTSAPRAGGQKQKGFGDWEKHTKGIGQKLLAKWGYEQGKGLGPKLQGRATPVEAVQRKGPKKATVGFAGPGSERPATERNLRQVDSEEEEDKEFHQQLQQWKRGDGEKKKKVKYNYKTAEEIISTGPEERRKPVVQSKLSKVKVIDYTGREQRVLSGYHAIHNQHDKPIEDELSDEDGTRPKKAFEMPELLHNIDILIDMSKEEIIENDRRLKYEKDRSVSLKYECEKMDQLVEQEKKQVDKLQEILDIIESCEDRTKPGCPNPMSLEECADMFAKIQDDFYTEYKMYGLGVLAVAIVTPLLRNVLTHWNPLADPKFGISSMKIWKDLLQEGGSVLQRGQDNMDAYDRLMWDVWMPVMRNAIHNSWSVRDSESIIEVLENWMPLLPPWIMDNILEQLIYPKLEEEINNWNPTTDTMPIHAWLHPWLPLMAERLTPLYGPIRYKLGNALTGWHPSDPSAKLILQPWATVWGKSQMEMFVMKHIVPKLQLCLSEFVINPHQQVLDPWNWVLSWRDIIPGVHMINLLEKSFFPKWLQVLTTWLSNSPNYDEVTKWYLGWKSMIPEPYLAHPNIKDHFNTALMIMNRSVSHQSAPGARENIAYLTHQEKRMDFEYKEERRKEAEPMMRTTDAASTVPQSFKQLLEMKAEENGIIFLPIQGRTQEAKQVYRFGKVSIYMDRRVIFMFEKNMWAPVSISNLISQAR